MHISKKLNLFLFDDEPVGKFRDDLLDLEAFSSMIASAALTNNGPFNIGVFAGWGQGKTSILRQAQKQIEQQENPLIVTAWVNAWQFEHEKHPIVPLIATIIDRIAVAKNRHKGISETAKNAFGVLSKALRAIAYGFSAKAGTQIPGFPQIEASFIAKDMIDRFDHLAHDPDPLLNQSLYYRAYELLDSIESSLRISGSKIRPKVVVFIDDLDRCQPDKAVSLLEALKLVLAQPGFIFVLGVDRRIIDSYLSKKYHDSFGLHPDTRHAHQYLDKIVQLPLQLPTHEATFPRFIHRLLDSHKQSLPEAAFNAFSTTAHALAAGCGKNPRTLIRTLNYLLTDNYLREARANSSGELSEDPFKDNSQEFLTFASISRITELSCDSESLSAFRNLVANDPVCEELANYTLSGRDILSAFSGIGSRSNKKVSRLSVESIKHYLPLLERMPAIRSLFATQEGQKWLLEHHKRHSVEAFLADRESDEHLTPGGDLAKPDDSIKTLIEYSIEDYQKTLAGERRSVGITTGIFTLDRVLGGGLRPSSLCIMCVSQSLGRYSISNTLLQQIVINGDLRGLLFTTELTATEATSKLMFSHANYDPSLIDRGVLPYKSDLQRIQSSAIQISKSKLDVFDASEWSLMRIRETIRRCTRNHKIDIVLIDSISSMYSMIDETDDSITQKIESISSGLKSIAREFNFPVVAVLGVDAVTDKSEQFIQKYKNGEYSSIEQSADIVTVFGDAEFSIDSEGAPEARAECHVIKNRYCPTLSGSLVFSPEYMKFSDPIA